MSVTCRVRCSGKLHRITLMESGHLVFHDHESIKAEEVLYVLGGERCRCLEVLHLWRERNAVKRGIVCSRLPAKLWDAYVAAVKLSEERGRVATDPGDHLSLPLRGRLIKRIRGCVFEAIGKCNYRRSKSRWAGGAHYDSVLIGTPASISGESIKVWSANTGWSGTNSAIYITVPSSWYCNIYRRGLAVVEGMFVLDVVDHGKNIYLVGKQGRGFSIYPAQAIIREGGLKFIT